MQTSLYVQMHGHRDQLVIHLSCIIRAFSMKHDAKERFVNELSVSYSNGNDTVFSNLIIY